jgi:cytidylate kinase
MLEIARETNAVIVGRGGQYFLQDHPQAVHVLLIADKAFRARFLQEHYDMNKDQARQVISRGDRRRDHFYKKIHHKNYNNASLYTVVLNMGRISIDKAVDVISELVKDL